MRCLLCQHISLPLICRHCQETLLRPQVSLRTLDDGLHIYSMYRYHEIAPLLLSKHTYIGASVYEILARASLLPFARQMQTDRKVTLLPIDDHVRAGYSHTAILAHAMRTAHLRPRYGILRAKNEVRYAGKSLLYRKSHPRGFTCVVRDLEETVIVDDIVTTGTTLLEASKALRKAGAQPLFAVTLADAREL